MIQYQYISKLDTWYYFSISISFKATPNRFYTESQTIRYLKDINIRIFRYLFDILAFVSTRYWFEKKLRNEWIDRCKLNRYKLISIHIHFFIFATFKIVQYTQLINLIGSILDPDSFISLQIKDIDINNNISLALNRLNVINSQQWLTDGANIYFIK